MATKNFTAFYATYTSVSGRKLAIKKGPSAYGKYYVIEPESGKYLSKGAGTLQGAQADMIGINHALDSLAE